MRFFFIVFTFFLLYSCKKENKQSVSTNSQTQLVLNSDTLLPLAIGNYWIYQKGVDDSLGI
jgi:hypothetical protein